MRDPGRDRACGGGKTAHARAGTDRHPGRRPHPARGPPGAGQDPDRQVVCQGAGLEFARIQFTPDMLPSDVVGAASTTSAPARWSSGPDRSSPTFCWPTRSTAPRPRPRPPARSHGGRPGERRRRDRKLPHPFVVLATDNPIEYEGTYELPEAQLDRFLMRLRLGYLQPVEEVAMVQRRLDRGQDHVELAQVIEAGELLAMCSSLEQIEVSPDLVDYAVAIVTATRCPPPDPGWCQPSGQPRPGAAGPGRGAHAEAGLCRPRRHKDR